MKSKLVAAVLGVLVLGGMYFFRGHLQKPAGSASYSSSATDATPSMPDDDRDPREWPVYGSDLSATKYSSLDAINTKNVNRLKPAWVFHTKHLDYRNDPSHKNLLNPPSSFETTPIMVDKMLYFCDPYDRVFAVDPKTGVEAWHFDPNLQGHMTLFVCRGVSTWKDTQADPNAPCARRIYVATLDARLIALDAKTGSLCKDFGSSGTVDLRAGLGDIRDGEYGVTSPPTVLNDKVITGAGVGDNVRTTSPSGVLRAFDVRTGAFIWGWNPVPKGVATGDKDNWTRATPNSWTVLSADKKNNVLFVPTGGPALDLFGGLRNNFDQFGASVVALDANSGQPKVTGNDIWQFQTVHHDLWDYDVPSPPTLFIMHRNNEDIPAVAQATKEGHLFFLSQEGLKPLFPVVEKPVPQTDVPGEYTSPTQPVPTIPPPLYPENIFSGVAGNLNVNGVRCHDADKKAGLRNEGPFTPPSLQGSVDYPGPLGGTDWGGVSIDPKRRILVLNQNHIPMQIKLIQKYTDKQQAIETAEYTAFKAHFNGEIDYDMEGAPYAAQRAPILDISGKQPCSGNPAGEMVGINIDSGVILWRHAIGKVDGLIPGSPNQGGSLITAGGLIFIGATTDSTFHALDTVSGREIWSTKLNTSAAASPMTYEIDGEQYVLIAAGGHALLQTKEGDEIQAFKLSK